MLDQSQIGQTFPPFTVEVERGKMRELALALGDDNPIYSSREAAQAAGYRDVPLYPTALTLFNFWYNTQMREHMLSIGVDVKSILHGEENYEYLAPVFPDDTLTGVAKLVDARQTKGQGSTSMRIYTFEINYTNQHNEPVARLRQVVINR